MKRSALNRRKPLRSAGWEREVLARLKRKPPRRHVAGDGDLVWRRDLGACIVCPAEGGVCAGPVQGHHAVGKQTLRRNGFAAFLDDVRNRVPTCEHRHEQHTTGYRLIPRAVLPASVFEFADELGLGWWLDKHYPAARCESEIAA